MSVLVTEEAKMVAAGCLIICLMLVVRAFTINAYAGRRRFGRKSSVFLLLTLGLIGAIHLAKTHQVADTYESVNRVNKAISTYDSTFRSANVSFDGAFEDYSQSFQEIPVGGDVRSDLMAIGITASKTRLLGEAVIAKYEVLKSAANAYQDALADGGETYRFAHSNLNQWAMDERTMLQQSSDIIKTLAADEEYTELSVSYEELSEVFQKLAQMTDSRYSEIEVNMPALESAIHYVHRANRYLMTVETHAATLKSFQGPSSVLADIEAYQIRVKTTQDGIRKINRRLDEISGRSL